MVRMVRVPGVGRRRQVGIIESFCRQIRQPDEELLEMTEEWSRLVGRHLGTRTDDRNAQTG
jgi:hypothetical protein